MVSGSQHAEVVWTNVGVVATFEPKVLVIRISVGAALERLVTRGALWKAANLKTLGGLVTNDNGLGIAVTTVRRISYRMDCARGGSSPRVCGTGSHSQDNFATFAWIIWD
jgi:hypothetical protein